MRYYHNVFGGAFCQTLFDKIQTETVHLIEFLCLEQFAIIHYLPKSFMPFHTKYSSDGEILDHKVLMIKSVSSIRTTLF